jgi:hypothetical protein
MLAQPAIQSDNAIGPRHRPKECSKFLERLEKEFTPALNLIMGNYRDPQQLKVRAWLKRHPRFVPHLCPPAPVG